MSHVNEVVVTSTEMYGIHRVHYLYDEANNQELFVAFLVQSSQITWSIFYALVNWNHWIAEQMKQKLWPQPPITV